MPGLSNASGGGAANVRAGRAYVELFARDSGVLRALERVKSKFQALGSTLIKSGAAVGGLGAAVTAGFKPALDALADTGKIGDLADLFQLPAEKASRLFGIMAAGGSDLRDAQEGLATFNQRINDALTGKGEEAADLFKQLGVGAQEFAGLDTAERFYKLLDAIKASNAPIGKLGLLMKAVGEDTGKNLGGVLNMTADQVRNLGDAFETSSADVQEAREATRAQALATVTLGKVWREIGVAIAPVVKEISERVVEVARPIAQFIKGNRELVATIFKVATGAVALGTALVSIGTVMSGAGAGLGVLVSIIGAIGPLVAGIKIVVAAISAIGAGPLLAVAAVAAAIGGLAYLFRDELAEYAQAALDKVREILDDLSRVADQLKESWGGVVAAIGAGDMNLAMEIALTTLELLWAQATDAMTGKWNSFTNAVVDGWHEVTDGLGPILDALWEDLNRGADEVVSAFHAIGEQITEGITWVQDSIQALRDEFSDVADALTMLVAPIVAPFAVAADLIRQIWDGISSNVMENLINLVSWIDRMDVQISDKFTNTFNAVARTVLDAAIKITEILDKVDPTDSLKGRLDELRGLRGGLVDVTAAETQAKLDKINADRDKAIESLREQREKAQKARDDARAADAAASENEVARLKARVDELNAQARALQRPGAGAKAPDLKAGAGVAAAIGGAQGSFRGAELSRRFGADPLFKRQVKAVEETADNTAATVRAAETIAKSLLLK